MSRRAHGCWVCAFVRPALTLASAKALRGGFLLEPVREEGMPDGVDSYTRITYVFQVDAAGWLPHRSPSPSSYPCYSLSLCSLLLSRCSSHLSASLPSFSSSLSQLLFLSLFSSQGTWLTSSSLMNQVNTYQPLCIVGIRKTLTGSTIHPPSQ